MFILKVKKGNHLHHHLVSVPDHQVPHHLHQPDHIAQKMSKGYNKTPNPRPSAIEGVNLGEMEKAWKNLAASEMRLQIMDTLMRYKVGFNDIEYFNLGLVFNSKTVECCNKVDKEVVEAAMKFKRKDESKNRKNLVREKLRIRKKFEKDLGKRSRAERKLVKTRK